MAEQAEEMVALCRSIDENAQQAYATLSCVSTRPELKSFWDRMSQEEGRHVDFWRALEESHISRGVTHLLTDADKSLKDLRKAAEQSRELVDKSREIPDLKGAFLLAYRMEFYLLHPAFELFFHLLPPDSKILSPETEYDAHISRFADMLELQGAISPELELLGDTLQQLWKKNRRLAVESSHDYLTRLYNRRGLQAVAAQSASLAHRNGSAVGVMMLDLDNFKALNDKFGHAAGDLALKKVSQSLKERLRASDIAARYGGEEFVVWLPSVNRGATGDLAESIREAIEQDCKEYSLTVSIGFTESTIGANADDDVLDLTAKADSAMYSAKQQGKNRIVEYDSSPAKPKS